MSKKTHGAKRPSVFTLLLPLYAGLAILFAVLIRRGDMQLLRPAGLVADFQSKILWGALIFAFVVGSAIIAAFFVVIFRYREDNDRPYEPSRIAGKRLQSLAWIIPTIVILVVSFLVWDTAHSIDPYSPLKSSKTPVTVQVVALRWKWLFIYPADGIASVNMLEIPAGRPINLRLTADAPMSSFWVPSLSGQIYAMPGMVTQLHIQADKSGTYPGSVAEINGDGYSGMDFTVKSVSDTQYADWKAATRKTAQSLDYAAYTRLAQPSSYVAPALYRVPESNLFDAIVMQFMVPGINPSDLQVRGSNL